MTIAAILCIGTSHNASENANVLVKLCGAISTRLKGLGIEGNHCGRGTNANRIARRFADGIPNESNGGWTWLNDGQNGAGSGMKDQSKANFEIIESLPTFPTDVVLVGHSRGAICCLRIAALLQKQYRANSPRCHLFLYDPVKRLAQGTDYYNRTIHANVDTIKVIAMEDEDATTAGAKNFKLMSIKTDGDAAGEIEYLRLPGTHGSATQVTGFPIGQVGYMLALEWLGQLGGNANVPHAAGLDLSQESFCRWYHRINLVNPVENGQRSVNDVVGGKVTRAANSALSPHTLGKRNQVLGTLAGENPYQGSGFFINPDHKARFTMAYPALDAALTNGVYDRTSYRLGWDMTKLRIRDRDCFDSATIQGLLATR